MIDDHDFQNDIACTFTKEPSVTEDGIKLNDDANKVSEWPASFQVYKFNPALNGRLTEGDD